MSALQTKKTNQVVMCIAAVFTHSVESLVSVDVNVTLHVAPRVVSVHVSSKGDKNLN